VDLPIIAGASVTGTFDSPTLLSSAFLIDGARWDDDRALVGAGVAGQISDRAQLGVSYDGEFSSNDRAHAFTARFRFDL
jgi:outer membrane autotransporter protein